jgi:hypothetical protein
MPLYMLSMIKADRCNNAITDGGHLLTRALNGLCFAACSRSLPPPQPGCPSGDPGSLPVPSSSSHVADLFAGAAASALSGLRIAACSRSLSLPVPYLSTHEAERFACAATHALNGLCIAACSRSLPPPQPGCPSGDPGPLPVPYLSTHVVRLFA